MTNESGKLADNKLLILYIIQKVNKPISYKELLELVISISEMNYFDFQQFFQELLDDNFILSQIQNDKQMIELTEQGKNALELTIDMLPGILKLNVDSKFKENFSKIKNEHSVFAEYSPINENEFSIKCKIIENNTCVFSIETIASSPESAKKIVDNWNNNADKIYPEILGLLTAL